MALNIWSCCAYVCSSNIYLRPFSNTWEKNSEWNHNRVACHPLWTAEIGLFWKEQANKRVLWSVSRWAFSPVLMLSCSFLCKAAVLICRTVLCRPFYTLLCLYLVWFRRNTHTDAIITNAHTHTPPTHTLCVQLHISLANSAVNFFFQRITRRSIKKWWQRAAYAEQKEECHSIPVLYNALEQLNYYCSNKPLRITPSNHQHHLRVPAKKQQRYTIDSTVFTSMMMIAWIIFSNAFNFLLNPVKHKVHPSPWKY